jgi:SAV_6107-like HEPN
MMASWQQWLAKGDVKTHQTSKQEVDNLRALIARDLADAAISGLSADRRFATAYNAALQTGTIAIACSGYRVSARSGHHKVTFEAAAVALGTEAVALSDYFDTCRRKRNVIDYMTSSVATDTEADELLHKVQEFHLLVESWINATHPALS